MRHNGGDARNSAATSSSSAAQGRAAPVRTGSVEHRRAYPRLRLHQRFLPLLVVVTLISTFGLASLAYLGARADAVASAQTRALQDVQVEHQLLNDEGAAINLTDGKLTVGVDNASAVLNGDTTLVDRTSELVNADATIYQLEGPSLVAIATNLPQVSAHGQSIDGSRAMGDGLSGAAYDALLGQCGATETAGCHHQYTGVVSIHGIPYVAGFLPLNDINGDFVGALSVAIPLDTVTTSSTQLAVVLLLVGLLVALGGLVAGFWLFGSLSRSVLRTLDMGLATVAESAGELELLARAQVERAGRHTRTALQVSEQVRALDALAGAMTQGQGVLRESAGEIWSEMSQPGLSPNPESALRVARQAAIVAGRVGTSAAEARDRCRQLVVLMNHILAESSVSGESGSEIERQARVLRTSVEQVEKALGKRLIQRQPGLSLPLSRRGGLRSIFGQGGQPKPGDPPPNAGASWGQAAPRQPQTGGPYAARIQQTGAMPAIRPEHLSGKNPYATGKLPAVQNPGGQSGAWRTPGSSQAGHSGLAGHPGRLGQTGEWNIPPSANPHGQQGQRKPPVPSTPRDAERFGGAGGRGGGRGTGGPAGNLGLPGLPEEYRSSWRTDDEDEGSDPGREDERG